MDLLLYSRPGCHLCDDMQAALRALDCKDEINLRVVNIDADPDLRDAFATRIPALVRADNRQVICQYQLDEAHVRACLAGT